MKRSCRTGLENTAFEMTDRVQYQEWWSSPQDSMTTLSSAGRASAHWASYTCGRWRRAASGQRRSAGKNTDDKYQGLAQDDDVTDSNNKNYDFNKKLLDYFRDLTTSDKDADEVDLQYLNATIANGADVNSADKYGQTVLHEISRAWNVDVMRFFLERGADVQRADSYGVTPLHVAAALDYEEMIRFLLERQADIGARTSRDLQTPLHFAAKNGAVGAVRLLLQVGADIGARDYKQRTPLQLAANLDRSEAAQTLMEMGADPGVQDSDGQLCISAMIGSMTPVAILAMNHFHVIDRMTRQQFYYLNHLEPEPPCKQSKPRGPTSRERIAHEPTLPLESIVRQGKLDLVMHPVVQKLITVKWNLYGRTGAWILLLLNFLFIVSWTTVAISVSVIRDEERPYVFPEDWWRVLVVAVALGFTMAEVFQEVAELLRSQRKLQRWKRWFECRTKDDLCCVHPMWPEEKRFLEEKIKLVKQMKPNYFQDLWNVFDWLVYVLLLVVFAIHVADIYLIESTLREYSLRLFAVTIIFLWLRLMKHVRAFRVMGPFIVMLGKIAGDVLRFLFLYAEIYIPYACAFWIIFGGTEAVPSMQSVPQMLYSLYRITLVDEYEFEAMVAVDPIMAHLLCGTFLGLSAILCVNLLIALLSDTFQRVYDNALANAVMQQASIILQVEESMPRLRGILDKRHIHSHCAPLSEFYDQNVTTDPDQHAEMKKITVQIKEILDEFLEITRTKTLDPQIADDRDRGTSEGIPSSLEYGESLRTLQSLQRNQNQQNQDLSALKKDINDLRVLIKSRFSPQMEFETRPKVDTDKGTSPPQRVTKL